MQMMIRKYPRKPSFKEVHGLNSLSYFEPKNYDYLKHDMMYGQDGEVDNGDSEE
jgi:hypothetical protein